MPVHHDDVHPFHGSERPRPSEEESLGLDRPARTVDGLVQGLDQPEAGLELGIENGFPILCQGPDDPEALHSNVCRHDDVEHCIHRLGGIRRDLHSRWRHAEHHGGWPRAPIDALPQQGAGTRT